MPDVWLPRMYVGAQIIVLVVCGVLVGTGHNSIIQDVFIAAAGGLTLTQGYRALTSKAAGKAES